MHIRNSAKAVIIEDNKVLLIKNLNENGFWYIFPGGGQDFNESLDEAVKRECIEELGAEVDVHELLYIRDYIGLNHEFDENAHQVEFYFKCSLKTRPNVELATETGDIQVAFEWISLDGLDSCELYPKVLRDKNILLSKLGYLGDIN